MLKLGTDDALVDKLGALAANVVEEALASGLAWDQAIAMKAASQGSGTPEQCAAHAQGRLQFGMDQSADVLKAWLR